MLLDPLRRQYAALAGTADAFEHRARGYRAMYQASRGNDPFPLIAAYGSLWARGFLRRAMQAGGALAAIGPDRHARWQRLNAFADTFRALHRRVFVESATLHRLAADPTLTQLARRALPVAMLVALRRADEASHAGAATSEAERSALYDLLFRWEQERVVGTAVLDAFAAVDWPLVTAIARRPIVRFGYFPGLTTLRFTDFSSMDERIAQGRHAYDVATAAGWDRVAATLDEALTAADWRPAPERAAACPLVGWLGQMPAIA